MSPRHTALFSFVACFFMAAWVFLGFSSPNASAQFRAPADAIPVTCTEDFIDDTSPSFPDAYFECVDNGGIDFINNYNDIPTGKYLFVTDINIISTQVFTTVTPAYMRLIRDPASGTDNTIYEMRITDSNSKHVSFQAPIIRLNPGDRMYAINLTNNSFTNDLRVFVTGWLTDSDTFTPTAVNGMQPAVQLASTPDWQVVLLMLMVVVTGAQYWQLRKKP